ncbi:MAG: hypothetical protein KJ947_05415 [Alphaproteobacteria bacterium]|nr:hypothetical protein [Alphaproteobacteria bacterium]MBU1549003.1 hypothetical protein [Alphaproteobacteria bacterium]MBU2334851.1 hypothetical protein [Alphaproteobacteria bacterium]MBU2386456.1 hypothetical protein [Alphaproteobacteria bacterium]
MSDREAAVIDAPIEPDTSRLETAFSRSHPAPIDIDLSFFSHKTRRSTNLVENDSENNYVKARRSWLDFDLREIVFITSIRVHAQGYESYHEMELSFVPSLSEEEKKLTATFSEGDFVFHVNDFTKGFGLRPSEAGLFKSAKLTKVEVSGVEKEHITGIVRFVQNVDRERKRIEDSLTTYFTKAQKSYEEIQSNQEALEALDESLIEKADEVKALEDKIQQLSRTQKKIQQDIEVAKTVSEEQTKREEAIQQTIEKLTDDRKELTSRISQHHAQLQELKANINLFPTELAGYVKQGTRNIRLYAALALIPLGVIVYVTYRLFSNSERLLDTIQTLGEITIFEFLISRLPYVAVSATILGICYTMLRGLISEIIAINRRRQELFKISIIATDVSYASQNGMELTDEERYDLRTQTKMELLKEHLRQNVGEDYTYSPGRSFLEHLQRLPHKKEPAIDQQEAA